MSEPKDWKWFGNAGHFICANNCRFHLCTDVGGYLVSTVGEYVPDPQVIKILADVRGIELPERGDALVHAWTNKNGFEEIGYGRTYETFVFKTGEGVCDCGCGMPNVADWSEIDSRGSNDRATATKDHMDLCTQYARAGAL